MRFPVTTFQDRIKSGGFTLIEMMVVVGIMAAIAVAAMPTIKAQSDRLVSTGLADGYARVQRAALRFYGDNGAWPTGTAALVAGGYLDATEATSVAGTGYAFAVVGADLRVGVNVGDANLASRSAGKVVRPSITGTTLYSTIDPPGYEAQHDALYARDGSRPLTGAMNANGQSITGANAISGVTVTGSTSMTAPIYYDSNNTAYYANPGSTSNMNVVNTARTTASTDMRAPLYYDSNNTAYYADLASTSNMNVVGTVRTTASADMRAPIFYDSNNTARYVDPASSSYLNSLYIDGALYDIDNTAYYVNPASTSVMNSLQIAGALYDSSDTSYYVDPASTSRLNYVDANLLRLRSNYTAGGACTTGQVGTTSTGELLSCVSGTWASGGGGYKRTVLFSGTLTSASGSRALSSPITNFDLLIIESYENDSSPERQQTILDVQSITYGQRYSIDATPQTNNEGDEFIAIVFSNASSFYSPASDPTSAIRQIIGVKW